MACGSGVIPFAESNVACDWLFKWRAGFDFCSGAFSSTVSAKALKPAAAVTTTLTLKARTMEANLVCNRIRIKLKSGPYMMQEFDTKAVARLLPVRRRLFNSWN